MEMKDSGCHIVNEKLVEEAKAGISNRAELDYLSELFKLLSDPTRMKLVLALSCGEMCVCDLGLDSWHDKVCNFTSVENHEAVQCG